MSPHWEGTSPATLYETGDASDMVEGIALHMTAAEIAALDPFEGYPSWYNRVNITMETFDIPESDGSTGG